MKFSEEVGNGPMNKKMIKLWWRSGSRSFTDLDADPYRDTGETCLGGGMHVPVLLVN